jgi:hypothetical protein
MLESKTAARSAMFVKGIIASSYTVVICGPPNGWGIRCGGGELVLTWIQTLFSSPSPECPC